jgi:predicted methyltransferase
MLTRTSIVVFLWLACSHLVTAQARDHVDVPRDQWQRIADIFRELDVAPGRHIADIGAGSGYFTTRLAKAVGPAGAVLAVDVNPVSLRELKQALGADAANVEIIRGDEDDPHLPPGRLDGALVVNAYHEFAEHAAMLRHVLTALKPGGRLVIVEPIPRATDTTREAQTKRHAIAIEFVEDDLKRAGFEILTRDTAFVTRPDHQPRAARESPGAIKPTDWLLAARRPADTRPSAR